MERLRVALYASDPITAAGIAAHLKERPDFQVVPGVQHAAADVLVVAADHVTRDVMTVMSTAAGQSSPPRIVLIVDELRQTELTAATKYGVVRLLPRHQLAGPELVTAVGALTHGSQNATTALRKQVENVRRDVLRPKGFGKPVLTSRETELIRLLADGHDTAAIAEKLCYSERTVKNIVQAILTRLQVRNRAHAVAYAMRLGAI